MRRAYATSTVVLNAILAVVGLAMIASTLARGGGALALGVVLGTLLMLLGAGRVWIAVARGGGER